MSNFDTNDPAVLEAERRYVDAVIAEKQARQTWLDRALELEDASFDSGNLRTDIPEYQIYMTAAQSLLAAQEKTEDLLAELRQTVRTYRGTNE